MAVTLRANANIAFQCAFQEDLRTRNMTSSAEGTITEPGRRVRQKAGLDRAILDKGWHAPELALLGKARYTGTRIVKINPAYTSQTCNASEQVDPKSRESQAVFRGTACGFRCNADVNAANNVLAAGLAVTGRGDLAIRRSVKRQPTTAPEPVLVGIPRLEAWGGSQPVLWRDVARIALPRH